MKKYLKLFYYFARYGLIWAMEYRLNFLLWALIGTMWSFLFIYAAELIFGQVQLIAGWTKGEALLVMASETMFVGFLWLFVFPSLQIFSELIRLGGLDFALLKPINSRFLISTRNWSLDQLPRIPLVAAFMVTVILSNHYPVTIQSILGYVFLFACGVIIFYNLFFSLTITNFWLISVNNFVDFFHNVLDMGRYPSGIYKGGMKIFVVFIVPVALVGTFPVQALLGKLDSVFYLYALILVISSTLLSNWFWNFALKSYSSASS